MMEFKTIREKAVKLIKDPVGILKRRFSSWAYPFRYYGIDGYKAEKYWSERLGRYGSDMRGVGNCAISDDENQKEYLAAGEIFLDICRESGVNLGEARILEIGCGNGFYTRVLSENGARHYLGIDITDVLFDTLKKEFNDFQFERLDVSTEKLEGMFDLIVMIDVTQHITNDRKFSFAMQNLRSHLNDTGVVILTFWPEEGALKRFYQAPRSIDFYRKEFPGYTFSNPVPFRDKCIVSIRP